MRRRLRSNNSTILKLAMVGIVAMAGGFLLTSLMASKGETQALSATEFQPGRIIDDSIFYNPNTMTAAEIDAFIDSHNPACDMWGTQKVYGNMTRAEYVKQLRASGNTKYHDPPFVCISEYYENPETHKTNFSTGGKKEEGMLSAGEIIYKAAQEYNINPQVLLVMLKKESYVWGDDWPHNFQYNTVMGYACPDGAPCDTKYYGFYNQVMMAAWQLNYYRDHIYSYNYRPYTTNNILYNPDRSCGSKSVYLENIATTSLYIYTPYVPNDAALANYPGTSWCGSYGNRNFYMYFREWFGSTLGKKKEEASLGDGAYYIALGSDTSKTAQLEESNTAGGTRISLKNRNNSLAELWNLEKQSDDTYVLINAFSNMALDVYGGSFQGGNFLEQWRATKNNAQRFVIIDNKDGSYSLAPAGNKNLALEYSTEDNRFYLQWYTGAKAQQFHFIHATQPIDDGIYRIISGYDSNYVIDVQGGAVNKPGANLALWTQNLKENQQFKLTYNPDSGYYQIQPSYNLGLSLDIKDSSTKKAANIQIWTKNDSCSQKWFIDKSNNNSYRFLSSCSGLALDVYEASAFKRANISTWTSNYSNSQNWLLEAILSVPQSLENKSYTIQESTSGQFLSKNTTLSTEESVFDVNYNPSTKTYSFISENGKYLAIKNTAVGNTNTVAFVDGGSTCAAQWVISETENGHYTIRNNCNNKSLNYINGQLRLSNTPSTFIFAEHEHEQSAGGSLFSISSTLDKSYSLALKNNSTSKGTSVVISNSQAPTLFYLDYDEETKYYTIRESKSNRVLDMSGGVSYPGADVILWDANNKCNQHWILEELSDGTYSILESCSDSRRTLDIYARLMQNGTNVNIWNNNRNPNQRWILVEH